MSGCGIRGIATTLKGGGPPSSEMKSLPRHGAFCGGFNLTSFQRTAQRSQLLASPTTVLQVTCSYNRRALVVDYGLRRVGLAVSVGFAPRPLPHIRHDASPEDVAVAVAAAARSTCSVDIVVGLPLTANGSEGEQAAATRLFAEHLVCAAPWATILLLDERFSTQLARASLVNANVPAARIPELLDSAAAVEIAERFFSEFREVQPIVLHKPRTIDPVVEVDDDGNVAGGQDTINGEFMELESFFSWRKNAMARATEAEAESGGRRKKRNKKKRRR
jgi:putative holliday junction resolvase